MEAEKHFEEINQMLMDPEVINDTEKYKNLMKEHKNLSPIIEKYREYKTVQNNLGHATASFTLDVYGHVTEQMKRDSSSRMEGFIQGISGLR